MLWMICGKTLKDRVRSRKNHGDDWRGDDQRVLEKPKVVARSRRKNVREDRR